MSSQDLKAVYFVRYRGPSAWIVQREGGVRPTSIQPNQRRAESAALKLARKNAPAKAAGTLATINQMMPNQLFAVSSGRVILML